MFSKLLTDQDAKQKMNVMITLLLEIYRVLMGAMLIVFIPQDCDGEICSLSQNVNRDDGGVTKSAFALNLFTLLSFLILYKIEVSRENKMIDYLHVNEEKPRDNDAVKEALELLNPVKKEEIWKLDDYYKKAGYFSMFAFGTNGIISTYVIGANYLNDKTLTALITNLLFMGFKIYDVFAVVNTEKNVFLSSFLAKKIQFNDIDPDHIDGVSTEKITVDLSGNNV